MKNLFFKSLLCCSIAQSLIVCSVEQNSEIEDQQTEESLSDQKRMVRLNNYPISIFTPQTQQFVSVSNIAATGAMGATGATGAAVPCLSALSMLRRTLLADLASGETGTFDTGVLYNFTSNPTGSPSSSPHAQSLTTQIAGYYLLELSYVGNQITTDAAKGDFYATFNLLVNGIFEQQFVLSTFGIRQMWQQIIWLNEGDVIAIQAGSSIAFLVPPSGIPSIDGLVWTLTRVGPCLEPD